MDAAWVSHIPLLSAAMALSRGPVLELGAGLGSTLLLHGLCAATGRRLVTLESDGAWLERFQHYARPWHELRLVADFRDRPEYSHPWSLAFVDHGLAAQRGQSVAALRRVRWIVVHDTCHPDLYGYEPLLSTFRYRFDWRPPGLPQTSVVSETWDVAALLQSLEL